VETARKSQLTAIAWENSDKVGKRIGQVGCGGQSDLGVTKVTIESSNGGFRQRQERHYHRYDVNDK
jgi:hypothetical protein